PSCPPHSRSRNLFLGPGGSDRAPTACFKPLTRHGAPPVRALCQHCPQHPEHTPAHWEASCIHPIGPLPPPSTLPSVFEPESKKKCQATAESLKPMPEQPQVREI